MSQFFTDIHYTQSDSNIADDTSANLTKAQQGSHEIIDILNSLKSSLKLKKFLLKILMYIVNKQNRTQK